MQFSRATGPEVQTIGIANQIGPYSSHFWETRFQLELASKSIWSWDIQFKDCLESNGV